MSAWDDLAEARIQEWLRRPAAERAKAFAPAGAAPPPLEIQLLQDALRILEEARDEADPAKKRELLRAAHEHETRLMVILENAGRPLVAQQFASVLLEARRQCG